MSTLSMDLDSAPEPGVVQIRGPRRTGEVALGYVLPVGTAIAVLAAILVGAWRGVFLGVLVFLFVVLVVLPVPYSRAGRRRRTGRDLGAGLPLAELGPTGARLRYELPTLRDRRRGEYRDKRYDAAVAWDAVTGWRRAIDPFGAAVIVLEVADRSRVTVRGRVTVLTRLYVAYLREGLGSSAVIRTPVPEAEQQAASYLESRRLPESPRTPAPPGWPVDGATFLRRATAETRGR